MQKPAVVFFLLSLLIACGQKPANKSANASDRQKEYFESKFVSLVKDTNVMMLIENVHISYGDLYVESDSALLDKPNKSVTAFGIKKIRFKGKEVDKKDYGNIVRYKSGDMRFYTE